MENFEITERWLMEAGGWQVVKRARMLVEQGRVLDVSFDGKLLRGSVTEGNRTLRSGMLIKGRTDVENLCRCREAQRTGMLCQHALALGVAVARGKTGGDAQGDATAGRPGGAATTAAAGRAKGVPEGNSRSRPRPGSGSSTSAKKDFKLPGGALRFRLPERGMAVLGRGTLSVQVEVLKSEEGQAEDLPLLAWLQSLGETQVRPQLMLQNVHLSGFFKALQGHPRVLVGEESLRMESLPLRLPLRLEERGEDKVALSIDVPEGVTLVISEAAIWGYLAERRAVLRGPRLEVLSKPDRAAFLEAFERSGKGTLERSWTWFFQHAETLEDGFRLEASALTKMPRLQVATPRFHFALEGSLNHLEGRLSVCYDNGRQVGVGETVEGFPFRRDDEPGQFYARNEAAESEATRRLTDAGFSPGKGGDRWVLKGEGAILRFFASELPVLQQAWNVEIGERFAHVTRNIERITPHIETHSSLEGGWLDVDLGYSTGEGHSLPRHEVNRLLQVGQSHTKLPNGKRAVVDLAACEELQEVLQDMEPDQEYGRYRIDASQVDYLEATLGAFAGKEIGPVPQAPFPQAALSDLATILRDYQKEGVCWMLARTQRGLSGILADEMGLGKTLQSLALIQAVQAEETGQSLIVCPKSLLDNWCAEAARFTPDLKVLKIHGTQRARLWKRAAEADLLVTSYGMLVRDAEAFRERRFLTMVLDEASAIKNSKTKNAQAAYALQGKYRFALTGTPVENSVRDLWSIMQFVAPGYLGGQKAFRERYEQALAAEAGAPAELQARLRRRMRPFMLRRTKQRVAQDLPDRIEKVLTCSLTAEQHDAYTSLLRAGREKVLQARDKGEGAARMTMLTTLLRLRQVSCDLRLLGGDSPKAPKEPSGKLEAIRELLQEAREGGHRVLIFSQFVSMLHLLRQELEAMDGAYCYLDGQTSGRQAEVDRFQKGDVPFFLISLKAGGYGLNLTAADTVIHFDPWWNPAVEAQATDRAHRIGQTSVVTAYKLIAADTVEEKILRLQRRKRQVIDAALDDEQPLMQGLTMADLEEVLELG